MTPIKRKKTGRITMAQARKLFGEIALGRDMKQGDQHQDLNDAWNWMYAGIELAQAGRVTAGHVAYLRKTPAAKGLDSRTS